MRRAIALLALLLPFLAGTAVAQPAILVLDASSSMWGSLGERTRMDVAKDAVAGLMSRWPATRPVGLVAYGHRRAQDCSDTELLRPPARGPAAMAAAARRVTPRGRTPIAEALRLAGEALGPGGGSIILLSDGIETCHPDPCAVAQQIARSGPRIAVHTIALALPDPAALAQLRCIAETTGGRASIARDAAELDAALDRAAAAPLPGPRASAPRAEPVPPPRLVVTLRLCPECDPMPGDARILLRRGGHVIATDGEPFGRFFDLPPGDYTVAAETPLFATTPVPVTVPPTGTGRAEIVLDAGWLVGEARSEPIGGPLPAGLTVEWTAEPEAGLPAAQSSPAVLLPAGTHRLRARLGNAEGSAEAAVAPGQVVTLPVPLRFGILALSSEGFPGEAPRLTITAQAGEAAAFGEWETDAAPRIPLAPGRYVVTAEAGGRQGKADVEIRAGMVARVTLRAGN